MPLFTNFSPSEIIFDDGFGPVKLKELAPTKWQLLEPLTLTTEDGITFTVPKDFLTDATSSPLRFFLTSIGGHYTTAAIAHDWFYENLNRGTPQPAAPTRFAADNRLDEFCRRARPPVNPSVRWAMWLAVRAFGGPGMKALGVRK